MRDRLVAIDDERDGWIDRFEGGARYEDQRDGGVARDVGDACLRQRRVECHVRCADCPYGEHRDE